MRFAAMLLLLATCAAKERPQALPFIVINCRPVGDRCQAVQFPREHAAYLYYEVLAAFELRGHKCALINPRLFLGDAEIETYRYGQVLDTGNRVQREQVSLNQWNDFGFATGWALLINKQLSPALTDAEIQQLVNQAVVSARAKVSVQQLREGH